jgi:hypothetical protein
MYTTQAHYAGAEEEPLLVRHVKIERVSATLQTGKLLQQTS